MRRTAARRARRAASWALAVAALAAAACSSSEATSPPATASRSATSAPPADDGSAAPPELPESVEREVQEIIDDAGLDGAGLVVVEAVAGLVHELYWGEFGPERISLIASTTKSITATVVLHLHDAGRLDVDAPIASVVPWADDHPDLTIAQLLSNSSGLVGLLPNPTYGPYLCQFVGDEIETCAETILTTPDDDGDVVPPDTAFRYGGAQWQVAGAVAEAATGAAWADLVDDILVQPCGLTSLGYNNHFAVLTTDGPFGYPHDFAGDPAVLPATENPNMEGGAFVSPRDYAVLLEVFLTGRCGDTEILPADARDRMFQDRVEAAYDGDAGSAGAGYGMGFFVDRDTGRFDDPGLYGARSWLDLDAGYGAYLIIEADGGTSRRIVEAIEDPIHQALTAAGEGTP